LRELERLVRISNGYLSLLESDSIREPSPKFLGRLAGGLGVSYSLLMELAGYVSSLPTPDPEALGLALELEALTSDERLQVYSLVRTLRSARGDR